LSSQVALTSHTLPIYITEAGSRSEVLHQSYDKFNLMLEDCNIARPWGFFVPHFSVLLPGQVLETANINSVQIYVTAVCLSQSSATDKERRIGYTASDLKLRRYNHSKLYAYVYAS
jgi:hypothetical protein